VVGSSHSFGAMAVWARMSYFQGYAEM